MFSVDETNKDNIYDVLQTLFEKFTKTSNVVVGCLGENCPQFSQIKAKQNLFVTIMITLITILVGISVNAHIELSKFKEKSYMSEIGVAAKRSDLTRQIESLSSSVSNNILVLKKQDERLDNLKLDVERIKTTVMP